MINSEIIENYINKQFLRTLEITNYKKKQSFKLFIVNNKSLIMI